VVRGVKRSEGEHADVQKGNTRAGATASWSEPTEHLSEQ